MKRSFMTKLLALSLFLVLIGSECVSAAGYSAPGSTGELPQYVIAPFTDFATLTKDDTTASNVQVGRMVQANCTVAGNISLKLTNTKSQVFPVAIGEQTFPWAVVGLNLTGTTATCVVSNWY